MDLADPLYRHLVELARSVKDSNVVEAIDLGADPKDALEAALALAEAVLAADASVAYPILDGEKAPTSAVLGRGFAVHRRPAPPTKFVATHLRSGLRLVDVEFDDPISAVAAVSAAVERSGIDLRKTGKEIAKSGAVGAEFARILRYDRRGTPFRSAPRHVPESFDDVLF